MVRAILSGIWTPADAGAPEAPISPMAPIEGVVTLDTVDHALPELIARSSAARTPLSLVLARPGRQASTESPPPGGIADLAAALTVSLAPDQQLLQAGHGQLAVVVTGGPGRARRQVGRLMQRAALAGAPVLTWAMASYPRDGSSSTALLEKAAGRLHVPAGHKPAGAASGLGRAALLAGAAAAALVGVFAYSFGSGRSANPTAKASDANTGQSGLSAAASGASSGVGSAGGQSGAVQAVAPPSWLGGTESGTSGSSSAGSAGSGSASTPAGPGSAAGTPSGPGSGQQQGTGTGTNTTIPGVTNTTIPGVTTTTVAGSGGGTSAGGNTSAPPAGGTTAGTKNQCTGLLQSLICTVNGLLG